MTPKITKNKELFDKLCELLQRKEVYDIVCALRGPDRGGGFEELKIKRWTASRLRGLFGVRTIFAEVAYEPLTEEGAGIIRDGNGAVGRHYLAHYEVACRAFQTLFWYDPNKVE